MVGVPGRSKGCLTCRRRKVKCGEEKPVCQRCTKGGYECLGYKRETLWRHAAVVQAPSTAARALPVMSSLQIVESSPGGDKATLQPIPETRVRRPSVPPELSLAAFQGDFCTSHALSNYVWRGYGCGWLEGALEGRLGSLALDSAKALSYSTFGASHKLADAQVKGSIQYGKCLRMLAGELQKYPPMQISKPHRGDLIVPILVLMMHASTLTDRMAAVFHIKAVSNILASCGPEAFQRQPLLNAFDAARATLVVVSLLARQKAFLDDPEWISVPWALDPMAKTQQSYLIDILCTVPSILEEHTKLENLKGLPSPISEDSCSPDESQYRDTDFPSFTVAVPRPSPFPPRGATETLRASLIERTVSQLETLYRWRWRWQAQYGHTVATDRTTPETNAPASRALGSIGTPRKLCRLSFSRADSAADIMLYNAVLMWLIALLWDLEPLAAGSIINDTAERARDGVRRSTIALPSNGSRYMSFAPLRRPGASVSVRDPAVEICQCYEWQSRHHGSNQEANCLYLLPIGMALSVLDAEPDFMLWIRGLLDADPITRGYCMVGDGWRTEGEDEGCRDVESGNMKSMSGFGLLVTREIDNDNVTPGRTNEVKTNVVDKVFNPGLVHLLLLRGRMGAH